MATTQDLRTNIIIRYNGVLHRVVEFHHHAPGNWRAMVILKLKNMQTGKVIEDPIGTRINKIYADASMAGFSLVAAYETTLVTAADPSPSGPTHLMLYFQKP